MTKNQRTINLLAIVAYLIVATVFFSSVSLPFIALTALLIFTVILAKNEEDNRLLIPVVGAFSLYFVVLALDVYFAIINSIIDKIQDWRLSGLEDKIKDFDGSESKLESLVDKYEGLVERMEANVFQEICDVILFFVILAVIALCVLSVISLLTGKDFRKSLVGKVITPVVMGKAPAIVCPTCGKVIKGEFCASCGTKKPE